MGLLAQRNPHPIIARQGYAAGHSSTYIEAGAAVGVGGTWVGVGVGAGVGVGTGVVKGYLRATVWP